ncbi:MAG: DUF3626 domain-containing protein [Desulfovibrio sp.]|nr:DUF3626 domain-containing protein [Desulfovibrio sp.]
MSQISNIRADNVVRQELQGRGIDARTGVYGDHTVQLGTGLPIKLDAIKTPSLPYAGFFRATKIASGRAGIEQSADGLLKQLTRQAGKLDAGKILGLLKAGQTHFERLNALGQITQAQKDNKLRMFTKSVEKLSNADLAAVYQSFTSAEMDLLQTALQREGEINPDARDARMAASRLFDLQALILKEVSNRSAVGILEDLKAKNPGDDTLQNVDTPKRLSAQWGDTENAPENPANRPLNGALDQNIVRNAAHPHEHDISAANLLTLVEVAAQSAGRREKNAAVQAQRLAARNIQGVSVKDMADIMRQSEMTCNMTPEALLKYIIPNPGQPISNIFHLAKKGIKPKGDSYLQMRDAVEKNAFPELSGHEARPDERPIYGSLNLAKDPIGGATVGYGDASIVFKPQVAKRTTYMLDDTFCASRISITPERKEAFYALLDDTHLPHEFVTALKTEGSKERQTFENWLNTIAQYPDATLKRFDVLPASLEASLSRKQGACDFFHTFLVQSFMDKDSTRGLIATHDNLESLIANMDDINGNALAAAHLRKMNGGDPSVSLIGFQYIEAQIQGPVIPSRDIAEIRITMASVPEAQRSQARRQLEQFGRQNGVKITYLDEYDLTAVGNAKQRIE